MVNVYGVALVDEPAEMSKAAEELDGGGPSDYVVLRVSEGGINVGRAQRLRELIKEQGFIARRLHRRNVKRSRWGTGSSLKPGSPGTRNSPVWLETEAAPVGTRSGGSVR
jgi:hypothetical protein